jgi:hypothetical protein
MFRFRTMISRLSLLVSFAPLAACAVDGTPSSASGETAAQSANDPKPGEKTASSAEALTGSYEWDQNLGHVTVMWPVSEGMCFITGMMGDFQGTGENIHIELDNGYWVLNGASQQNSVTAWATCQAWSDLGGYGYGTQEWFVEAYGGNGCGIGACGSTYWNQQATLWNNVNFCSLSYISGNMNNGYSWMDTWFDGTNWNLENSENATQAYMWSGATCMGLKLSHPMAFTGQYSWSAGQQPVALLPVSEAVCALTEVQGGFRGNGEQVQISNFGGTWYLWGTSAQSGTGARASCVYLHQS